MFWPSFMLGLFHAIFPCEDKAIFGFYAFGVSRDWRSALNLINFFGLGLIVGNLLVSLVFIFFIGGIVLDFLPENFLNYLAAGTMMIAGIVMFVLVSRDKIGSEPTSEDFGEFVSGKKRHAFLLGVLSGIPPCFMELTIYIQAALWSAQSGWYTGLAGVLFFGVGTWLGLFPLGLVGILGSETKKKVKKSRGVNPKVVEKLSALLLLLLGLIYLFFAIVQVRIFSWG
ncbi:MAG: urease accessory protein UreH domain-containing protein [Promethearchaeota archaeon]